MIIESLFLHHYFKLIVVHAFNYVRHKMPLCVKQFCAAPFYYKYVVSPGQISVPITIKFASPALTVSSVVPTFAAL